MYYMTCDAIGEWLPVEGDLDRAKKRATLAFERYGISRGLLKIGVRDGDGYRVIVIKHFNTKWIHHSELPDSMKLPTYASAGVGNK
jgi:hypothetical protein